MDTIFVAFSKSDNWFRHFLKKGFAHCSVLLPCEDGWLEIDPAIGILQLIKRTDKEIAQYTKLLEVEIKDYKFRGIPLNLLYCVNMVEYMLGKSINAITPYRLYKKLTGKLKKTFNTREILG